MPKLTIITGSDFTTKLSIKDSEVLLGRADDNDVVLDDLSVSRRHARVVRENGHYYLEDLDSQAGTFLNARKVQREQLVDGDEIGIGRFSLLFQEDMEGAPVARTMLHDLDEIDEQYGADEFDDEYTAEDLDDELFDEDWEPSTGDTDLDDWDLPDEEEEEADDWKPSSGGDDVQEADDLLSALDAGETHRFEETDDAAEATMQQTGDSQDRFPEMEPSEEFDEVVEPLFLEEELQGLDHTAIGSDSPKEVLQKGHHAKLVMVHKGNALGEEPLAGFDLSIGREKSNDITLEAIEVSRFHAKITYEDEHYFIEDLGSSNGTFLNHRSVDRAKLTHGSEIQIGNFTLLFRKVAPADSPDPSQNFSETLDDVDLEEAERESTEYSTLEDHTTTDETLLEDPEALDFGDVDLADLKEVDYDSEPAPPSDPDPVSPESGTEIHQPETPQPAPEEEDDSDIGDSTQIAAPQKQGIPVSLMIQSGKQKGEQTVISKDQITIGREKALDIVIDDESVSRNHALLVRGPIRYEVQDLGSTNGTKLNGENIDRAPLEDGDILQFGNIEAEIRFDLPRKMNGKKSANEGLISKKKSPVFLAILAVTILSLLIALAVVLMRSQDSSENAAPPPATSSVEDESRPSVIRFRQLLSDRRLDEAATVLDSLNSSAAASSVINTLQQDLQQARQDRNAVDQADALLDEGEFQQAVELTSDIPTDSPFFNDAQDVRDGAETEISAELMAAATAALDDDELGEARASLRQLLDLQPDHAEAAQMLDEINADPSSSSVASASEASSESHDSSTETSDQQSSSPAPSTARRASSNRTAARRNTVASEEDVERVRSQISKAYEIYSSDGPAAALDVLDDAKQVGLPRNHAQQKRLQEVYRDMQPLAKLVAAGHQHLDAGDLDAAANAWYQAMEMELEILPSSHSYLSDELSGELATIEFRRAKQLLDSNQTAEAYQYFEAALELNPDHAAAAEQIDEIDNHARSLYREAYVYMKSNPDRAREGFERVLALVPQSHQYHDKAEAKLRQL